MTPTRCGIYVASRANIPERSAMWRAFRDRGFPIVSTWIDEAGIGESPSMADLWRRVRSETRCVALVFHVEPGDLPMKGALVEVGMALAYDARVFVSHPGVDVAALGSWIWSNGVTMCAGPEDAMQAAAMAVEGDEPAAVAWFVRAIGEDDDEVIVQTESDPQSNPYHPVAIVPITGDPGEAEGIAHLIASAPALLARVRELEAHADRFLAHAEDTITKSDERHDRAIMALRDRAARLAATNDELLAAHAAEMQRRLDLEAELAELRATLANERGEGAGPSEGWSFVADFRRWVKVYASDDIAYVWIRSSFNASMTIQWHRFSTGRESFGSGHEKVVRAAMIAADRARVTT